MSGKKKAIRIPIDVLRRLKDVLNQIARTSPNLNAERIATRTFRAFSLTRKSTHSIH
jgi:hypothetical protein